jgi:hypothetical protein
VRVAFTLDDIPLWPRSYPPAGYTIASIMQRISDGLVRNGVQGVYGFGNSWSLAQHPGLSAVLDAWHADGHHVGNHTHAHLVLTEIDAIRYCGEIDLADHHLEPWLSKAPSRYFRYTLCHWGDTEEKRAKVMAHLASGITGRSTSQAGGTNGTGTALGATPATAATAKPWPSSSGISSTRS